MSDEIKVILEQLKTMWPIAEVHLRVALFDAIARAEAAEGELILFRGDDPSLVTYGEIQKERDQLRERVREECERADRQGAELLALRAQVTELERQLDNCFADRGMKELRERVAELEIKLHEANMSLPMTNSGWPYEKKLHQEIENLTAQVTGLREALEMYQKIAEADCLPYEKQKQFGRETLEKFK